MRHEDAVKVVPDSGHGDIVNIEIFGSPFASHGRAFGEKRAEWLREQLATMVREAGDLRAAAEREACAVVAGHVGDACELRSDHEGADVATVIERRIRASGTISDSESDLFSELQRLRALRDAAVLADAAVKASREACKRHFVGEETYANYEKLLCDSERALDNRDALIADERKRTAK